MQGVLGKNKIIIWQSGIERPKKFGYKESAPWAYMHLFMSTMKKKLFEVIE